MLAHTVDIVARNKQAFTLRWDMHAIATFERLAGVDIVGGFEVSVANVLDLLWCALDADAASRNEPAPIPHRQWATMFAPTDVQKLMNAATELLGYNSPEPTPPGKVAARKSNRAKKSRSRGSTSGARSTSASVSTSSGA